MYGIVKTKELRKLLGKKLKDKQVDPRSSQARTRLVVTMQL